MLTPSNSFSEQRAPRLPFHVTALWRYVPSHRPVSVLPFYSPADQLTRAPLLQHPGALRIIACADMVYYLQNLVLPPTVQDYTTQYVSAWLRVAQAPLTLRRALAVQYTAQLRAAREEANQEYDGSPASSLRTRDSQSRPSMPWLPARPEDGPVMQTHSLHPVTTTRWAPREAW